MRAPTLLLRACAGAVGVATLATCDSPDAPSNFLILCSSAVTISVSQRASPAFSWTPRCGATYLEVTSANRQVVYWIVKADTGRFPPPVSFGIAPPGMLTVFGPQPLPSGSPYLVRLGLLVDENSFVVIGEQPFTN